MTKKDGVDVGVDAGIENGAVNTKVSTGLTLGPLSSTASASQSLGLGGMSSSKDQTFDLGGLHSQKSSSSSITGQGYTSSSSEQLNIGGTTILGSDGGLTINAQGIDMSAHATIAGQTVGFSHLGGTPPNLVDMVKEPVVAMAQSASELMAHATGFLQSASQSLGELMEQGQKLMSGSLEELQKGFGALIEQVSQFGGGLKEALGNLDLAKTLPDFNLSEGFEQLSAGLSGMGEHLGSLLSNVSEIFQGGNLEAAGSMLVDGLSGLAELAGDLVSHIDLGSVAEAVISGLSN